MSEVTQEKYDALLVRFNSAQDTIKFMEKRLQQYEQKINVLEAEKTQFEQNKVMQSQIITHQLSNSDNNVRKLQDEIIELKAELKKYKDK